MSESQLWDDVDGYFITHLAADDDALAAARRRATPPGCPR